MGSLAESKGCIVDFLVELMNIDSTTGQEGPLATAIAEFLLAEGFDVDEQPIDGQPHRRNLLIRPKNVAVADIKLLFNTHLDTVPPYTHPRIGDDCVYGRGSNDAKGQIAAMIFALRYLAAEFPLLCQKVGILLVVGEETDHIGMTEANKLGLEPDYLVVGEPTELTFAHAQKGALKLNLQSHGRAAHSGYPEKGHSAVHEIIDLIADLRRVQWPQNAELGQTTLNVGTIKGGQALNALAEFCEANLMFRVVDSVESVLQTVYDVVKGRAEITVLGQNEPLILTKPPEPYKSWAVAFNTDIPYFEKSSLAKGVFLFGGGSITNAHSKHEHIEIQELEKSVEILVDLVQKLLA